MRLQTIRLAACLLLAAAAGLAAAPAGVAWAWPLPGPVLRPFLLGPDPYAAGQHRGIDVAGAAGEVVRAPAGGTVSFAGAVPVNGLTITIQTGDGWAVTLAHLGSLAVARGAVVAEGQAVGAAASSGEAEWPEPYVHLGIRLAADPQGYRDPLELLPARPPVPASPAPRPFLSPSATSSVPLSFAES